MRDYDIATYGDRSASDYDTLFGGGGPVEPVVAFLAGLVPGGDVLELGVGTGRVAIPMARLGMKVYGIDSSEAMLEALRRKPGGSAVQTILGDFADVPVDHRLDLVYVLCSTFFFLRTQQEQVRCFRNVAARLRPGGAFVVEASCPPYRRMNERQFVDSFQVDAGEVAFFLSMHDPFAQRIDRQQVVLSEQRTRLIPISYRYAWPSELDLMAELAGMSLASRDGGWAGEELALTSDHVSVYRKNDVPDEGGLTW